MTDPTGSGADEPTGGSVDGARGPVVLVSDRGPVTFVAGDHCRPSGGLVARPRSGSVTELLHNAARRLDRPVRWFSPSTTPGDRAAAAATDVLARTGERLGYRFDPLPVAAETYRRYYEDAGVRMLWFAHHDLWEEFPAGRFAPPDETAYHEAYRRVNAMFAERIAATTPEDAPVLFHDYQFATAPGELRRLRPGRPIALFVHTPFATVEALRRLPAAVSASLFAGMLGADLVGFQSRRWAERFLDCCARWGASVDPVAGTVRYRDRTSWVRSYPVRVAAGDLDRLCAAPRVRDWERRLAATAPGRRVVRVDRLDPSKNVVRGFDAFGILLDTTPALRGQVQLVACLVPSRPGVPEYAWYAEAALAAAARVNRRHPGSLVVHHGADRERALAALRGYDVLIVNPLLDGMNLVSQEGPVVNTTDGVLVLSTGAGSADLLGEHSVPIRDPHDVPGTAAALATALAMPRTIRARRARALRTRISEGSPARWLADQVDDLAAVHAGHAPAAPW